MRAAVVVTGASRGIGRALCLAFARDGHPVVAAARSAEDLALLAAEIQALGGTCETVVCDLAEPEGRRTLEAAVSNRPVVGLVNNAGIGTAGEFAQVEREKDVGLVRLNVEAVVDLCHGFLPLLAGRSGAFIMNVASAAAFQPVPLFATYAASKAFVLSFSEALADELAPRGIHVLALCPGVTKTGFQAVADVVIPGDKAPSAEEVADFALRALAKKKRVAIHGAKNVLLAFSTRLGPRSLVTKSARKVMEPWFAGRKQG